MQGKAKSNSVVTTGLVEGNPSWRVLGIEKPIVLDLSKVSAAARARAEIHGWFQRGSDGAALSRNPTTGQPASPQEKWEAIAELVAHYETGTEEWAMRSGGGGQSITLQAVARVRGIAYEQAEEFVGRYAQAHYKGDMKAALAFLRSGAKVGAMILTIRAENQPKPVLDADKALGELG